MKSENTANWIWIEESDLDMSKPGRVIYFRKTVEYLQADGPAEIIITADSKYKLYINGSFINMGPQKGDRNIHYFDRIDIKPFLNDGGNIVVAEILEVSTRHRGGNFSVHRTGCPGLYIQGSVFNTDESWKYTESDVSLYAEDAHFAPLSIFENTAGTSYNSGVFSESFDDCNWKSVKVRGGSEVPEILLPECLQERTIPLLYSEERRFENIQVIRRSALSADEWNNSLQDGMPLVIAPETTEIIEISAGAETTGFPVLKMSGGAGATISLLTSECYAYDPVDDNEGHFIPLKGDRTDSEKGKLFGFTDTYSVSGATAGESVEVYETFWFRTFRYIRLEISTGNEPLVLKDFLYRYFAYPLEIKSSAMISDQTFDGIWDISERSLRLCMHETYEDCPFYEQMQYAMDSRSQILYTYAVSADDRLARQCMEDFRRSSKFDGMINCSYPNFEDHIIPGFSVFYIGMVYDHMMYFGDRILLQEHLPSILGVINFFRRNLSENGLVKKIGGLLFSSRVWSFIDWTKEWKTSFGVPPATFDGPITMESLLFILGLKYSAEICSWLGYADLSAQLLNEAASVQSAVKNHCRRSDGMFTDGPYTKVCSQHSQVFAILTGTVSAEEGKGLLKMTLDDPESYAQCSVAMMFYLFRALEMCGMYDRTDALWNIWRDMLKKNLTTCEEDNVLSRSDCHAWGALALYELPSVILGVRPSAPGFSEMEINPVPGLLQWAQGKAVTPRGTAEISWKLVDRKLEVKADIPPGIAVKEPASHIKLVT